MRLCRVRERIWRVEELEDGVARGLGGDGAAGGVRLVGGEYGMEGRRVRCRVLVFSEESDKGGFCGGRPVVRGRAVVIMMMMVVLR